MTYNPATDFLALWRNIAGVVSKVEMPGLDYVVAALARTGLITVAVSATAPVANQSTTAWLQTAVPSNSAEGVLNLWNPVTGAYQPATAALFLDLLQTAAGQNGVSWWTSTGGPPINTVGNNGDFAVRLDAPNGIFGPKAAGVWPANPIPGTADVLTSTSLDNTFGATEGQVIYRGPAQWTALPIGGANQFMVSSGVVPEYVPLSVLLDTIFSNVQGSILFRGAAVWSALGPGTNGFVLTSGGVGANPAWGPQTPDIPSGTVMPFYQAAAPVGWTQITTRNDFGLRVVSGIGGGVTTGSNFSSVFAQTAVGNTTITQTTSPSHTHTGTAYENGGAGAGISTAGVAQAIAPQTFTTSSIGGDGPHTHSVNLSLAYLDLILASKN